MSAPAFGVVVLNFRGLPDTVECVDSLLAAEPPPDRIVLVDNGSGDGSAAALASRYGARPGVTLHALPENLGYAGGMNHGARVLLDEGAGILLLLNNDTVADPGFLPPLRLALAPGSAFAVATPKILYPDRATLWSLGERVCFPLLLARRVKGQPDGTPWPPAGGINAVTGCAMALRREVFERIGLFDEAYFAYVEEVDLCKRAGDAGFRFTACPGSVIVHKEARVLGEASPAQLYLKARNRCWFIGKNVPPLLRPLAWAWNLAVLASWAAPPLLRGKGAPLLAAAAGVSDALRGRMGPPRRSWNRRER